jgi:hypothetical protein
MVHALRRAVSSLRGRSWLASGLSVADRHAEIETISRVLSLVQIVSESGHPGGDRELSTIAGQSDNPAWLRDWARLRLSTPAPCTGVGLADVEKELGSQFKGVEVWVTQCRRGE